MNPGIACDVCSFLIYFQFRTIFFGARAREIAKSICDNSNCRWRDYIEWMRVEVANTATIDGVNAGRAIFLCFSVESIAFLFFFAIHHSDALHAPIATCAPFQCVFNKNKVPTFDSLARCFLRSKSVYLFTHWASTKAKSIVNTIHSTRSHSLDGGSDCLFIESHIVCIWIQCARE